MYGLVLEGGGARGAYEIGACKAFIEKGFIFSAIVGTSIGAINGAMIASNRINEAEEAWLKDIFPNADTFNYFYSLNPIDFFQKDFNLHKLKSGIENLKKNVSNIKPLEISPLEDFIEKNISEEEIRKSKIDFGLATFNLSDKEPMQIFLKDMKEGELKKYLLATCYLPFFKPEPLEGKYYLDGFVFNNLPFEMLEEAGLPLVIIRVNKPEIWDKKLPEDSIVVYPKKRIGGVLEFNKNRAKVLLKWGYLDALKVIDNLMGEEFYIKPISEQKAIELLNNMFSIKENDIENISTLKTESFQRKLYEDLYPSLAKELGLSGEYTYADLLIALVEEKAKEEKIDNLKIYSCEELISLCYSEEIKDYEEKGISIFNKYLKDVLRILFVR